MYRAAVARAAGVRAKDEFSVGFEARAMRPLQAMDMILMKV